MGKKKTSKSNSQKGKNYRESNRKKADLEREASLVIPAEPADRAGTLNAFRLCLLLTGLSGIVLYIFWAYISFFAGDLANGNGEPVDDTYGLNLIIFSMAIGGVYSFINRRHLSEITDPDGISLQQFRIKTERSTTGALGIALCFLFTLFYWVGYCRINQITSLVEEDGTIRSFSGLNLCFIIVMAAAAALGIFTLIQARQVSKLS